VEEEAKCRVKVKRTSLRDVGGQNKKRRRKTKDPRVKEKMEKGEGVARRGKERWRLR